MPCTSGIRKSFVHAVVKVCGPQELQEGDNNAASLEVVRSLTAHLESVQREAREAQSALAEAKAAKDLAFLQARRASASSPVGGLQARSMSLQSLQSLGAQSHGSCGDLQGLAGGVSEDLIGYMTSEELDVHFDLVIIGGGPVGLAAAIKCACLGHRAIIIDKPKLPPRADGLDVSFGGPTGLFSKALRDTAKHVDVPSLQSMHLDDEVIWHQIRNMCMRLAQSNASHQVKTLKNFKVDYLQAHATVISSKSVMVQRPNGESPAVLATDHVLVATGSKPMRPKEIPFDDVRIFDSDTINTLTFLPKSVAIMGSGIIAIEYAKIFRKLGVKVCMLVRSECLTALERIGLDSDVAKKLIQVLHADDVEIYENTSVKEYDVPLNREDGLITMHLKSSSPDVPSKVKVDVLLAATGRTANMYGWGAEKLNMKLGKHVEVDDCYETSVKGIYAAGDVIGPPSLASTGMYQAQAAVLELFGEGHMNKFKTFPVGMWTTPECGYYGLTKAAAKKEGMEVEEGCVEYSACLRGRVFAPVGLLKLVFRRSDGVIVGVHILGEDACELVHYGMDLVCQGVSIFKVMTTCFTAVTFHELFKEAALNGNSKLEFGLEWHKVLSDIGVHMDNHEHGSDLEKMKAVFQEIDTDNDQCLNESELVIMFNKYGVQLSRATVHNLVRLLDTSETNSVHWDQFAKLFDILEEVRSNSHFSKDKTKKQEAQKLETLGVNDKFTDQKNTEKTSESGEAIKSLEQLFAENDQYQEREWEKLWQKLDAMKTTEEANKSGDRVAAETRKVAAENEKVQQILQADDQQKKATMSKFEETKNLWSIMSEKEQLQHKLKESDRQKLDVISKFEETKKSLERVAAEKKELQQMLQGNDQQKLQTKTETAHAPGKCSTDAADEDRDRAEVIQSLEQMLQENDGENQETMKSLEQAPAKSMELQQRLKEIEGQTSETVSEVKPQAAPVEQPGPADTRQVSQDYLEELYTSFGSKQGVPAALEAPPAALEALPAPAVEEKKCDGGNSHGGGFFDFDHLDEAQKDDSHTWVGA